MKKKMMYLFALLGLVIFVGACGAKKTDPKDAATAFLNAEFYGKDTEQYEKIFNQKLPDTTTSIKDGLNVSLGQFGLSDEILSDTAKNLQKAIADETSFTIKEVSDKNKSQEVNVEIYGLDFSKIIDTIQEKGEVELVKLLNNDGVKVEKIEDLEKITDPDILEKANKLISNPDTNKKLMEAIIPNMFKDAKKVEKPKTVKFTLEPGEKKSEWKVSNYDKTVMDITQAMLVQ